MAHACMRWNCDSCLWDKTCFSNTDADPKDESNISQCLTQVKLPSSQWSFMLEHLPAQGAWET